MDKKISKTLSYWLRHKPDAGGLTLDDNGWAPVADVMAAFARDNLDVSEGQLKSVVRNNDKQRFELDSDQRRIRARQGHSIAIEGDWQQAVPPPVLYHGTVDRFLGAILAEGLKPMKRHHVHLSPDVETASKVGQRRGKPVILHVDAASMAADGAVFLLTGNGVWLTDSVPPEYVTLNEGVR